MTPFFFGQSEKQLFGAYDPPRGGSGRSGIVFCYPIGQEYLAAHRALRFLARRLSDVGHHVLRFDYYGTGDSAGETSTMTQHVIDVETAIDELKEIADLVDVGLIGLRYGATLAALAASRRSDVSKLVLWDLAASISAEDSDADDSEGGVLDSPAVGRSRKALLVTTVETGEHAPRDANLTAIAADWKRAHVPDFPVWIEADDFGGTALPVNVLPTILEFMS